MAQLDEVRHALGGSFDVAVEHGRIGVDTEAVGGAMDFEPFVGADFSFEGFVMHAVVEDFGAAAGHAAQAGFTKGGQNVADAHAGDAAQVNDLDGGEGFDVELGAGGANAAEHVEVVIEFEPGVEAADDVDFGRAGVGGFSRGRDHLLDGHFVRALFAALAVEGAELAREGAHIGVIDVPVAVVKNLVAVKPAADEIGETADAVDVAAFGSEPDAVFHRQARRPSSTLAAMGIRAAGRRRGMVGHWSSLDYTGVPANIDDARVCPDSRLIIPLMVKKARPDFATRSSARTRRCAR